MAEKKKPQIVNVQGEDITAQHDKEKAEGTLQQGVRPPIQQAGPVGNSKGLRIGAVVLWIAAIIFEVLAVLVVAGKVHLPVMTQMVQMIVFLVLDLACVVIGAQLWKKANHIDPVSEANPTKFWIWNNMGMIVCAVAFVPFIILLLTNKNADKNTKLVGTVVAINTDNTIEVDIGAKGSPVIIVINREGIGLNLDAQQVAPNSKGDIKPTEDSGDVDAEDNADVKSADEEKKSDDDAI